MYYQEASLAIIKALEFWGVKQVYGVTGGGAYELSKHLMTYEKNQESIGFFTIAEYLAGFAPIGSFVASGQMACTITVPGAGSKLVSCGMSDARFLRIPALYLMPLNKKSCENQTPLQDATRYGINWVAQLHQELGEDVVYLESVGDLSKCLTQIALILSQSRPVAFCFHPDEIKKEIELENFPALTRNFFFEKNRCDDFLLFLNQAVFEKKNIYLYVCGEAVYEPRNFECIKRFQELLNAQVVCSVNGAFACVDLPNFYGHVGIGGHPDINHRWKNLGANDVLIILGADFGDYHFLSSMSEVSSAWILSNLYQAYGFINESYQHRFAHPLHLLKGPIHQTLSYLIQYPISKSTILAKGDFEKFKPQTVASEKVNLLEFYQKINKLWKKQTLCFEDVCTAYRDRQYVLPIPNKNVQFFSSQDGSAMGGALGIGVGAKLAAPQKHCFIFMGDGCSRLVFGALSELAHLGIVIFILNNQSFGIVDDVYQKIYSHIDHKKHHVKLAAVDFVGLAKACFWDAEKLKPDLSNLESLIDKAYSTKRSLLIEIPCESFQSLGFNPRKLILK